MRFVISIGIFVVVVDVVVMVIVVVVVRPKGAPGSWTQAEDSGDMQPAP